MKKEITIQIFTGGYKEHHVTFEQIEKKLKIILEAGTVKRVIMGWSLDRELYEQTIELLRPYKTQCFLWLPVFSETGILEPVHLLIDDKGQEVKIFHLKEGENFEFYCPKDETNITGFLNIFEKYFSGIGFDGVFLDKIRYGAFSNGISGVFGCFCDKCRESYEEYGLDPEQLKAEMEMVRSGRNGYGAVPLKITDYQKGVYEFENPMWEVFFHKKSDDIMKALTEITAYFRSRKLLVGMDTFSPFTAYFAGQDIVRLGTLGDFIKPMMYRITNAPAGLPFEAECLIGETAKEEGAAEAFFKKINCHSPKGQPFDMEFVRRELKYLTDRKVKVNAGIEINRNEAAAADVAYIRENLRELSQTEVDGFVLSWDLLSAPEANISEVVEYMKHWR